MTRKILFQKSRAVLQLFMLTMTLFAFKANAQCPPGDVTLGSQAEVDAFATNYPGCTEIQGNLTIQSLTTNITNLNGLSALTTVGGYLYIHNNAALTNLDGLHNITSVGYYIVIKENPLGVIK